MAFQPLGYSFACRSPMTPRAAKAAIREKKKGWFESSNGPRGWIMGPFICLWLSAFDRHGPMIIGIIRQDGLGTRVVGRAGADLNGTAMFLLLTPFMSWALYQMARHGEATLRQYVLIGVLFGLGLPFTLWINSRDRGDADPIVKFIRTTTRSPNL